MDRTRDVLTFLREKPDYVSGDFIAAELGISRTAIWKFVHQLERLGYVITKLKGRGYKLIKTPDKLYAWEIQRHFNPDIIGKEITYKDIVDSTNSYAFKLALDGASEGTCVLADAQKAGRGRLNRVWFSPAGENLYLSVILKPHVHPSNVYPITFISSLAVYDTVETITGIKPTLKWPNDLLINGKKICGTLLELSTEADMVRFVVVGIGLDINMREKEVKEEIDQKATSLFIETNILFERSRVCGILLSNLEKYYILFKQNGENEICRIWEDRSCIKGKYLEINQMGRIYKGISEGIDNKGALLLNIDGKINNIIAGDVVF
jgi:BirA family transcriptional regulator, biotin operon repressor / biotin---[acetyl-CoA-carboxylase] ligase